jgi:hypothetical protein
MTEYDFFEYTAKLMSTRHAEDEGESVHCVIEMNVLDQNGRRRQSVKLEEEAGYLILFALNPGPNRRIAASKIWKVDEHRLKELAPATVVNRIGSSQIFFYNHGS